jgi:hypothetical protein
MDSHSKKQSNKIRRALMWTGLVLIILLIFMSIYGAFIGAERAQVFFNRLPLAVYWVAFGFALTIGIVSFRRLIRIPGLLLIHAGCVVVLCGGIWGSQAGHALQKRFFGIDKIRAGRMAINEGQSDNRILPEGSKETETLPFDIKLKDFRMEFYEPHYLIVQSRQGQSWRIPAVIGRDVPLGGEFGSVKVLRRFENFRISTEGENRIITDNPQSGSNPALEIRITQPDGQVSINYAFEKFPGHGHPEDKLLFGYQRIVSEYISELQVLENGRVVAEKDIEVNHPLGFGGYHFYQHDYDHDNGRYTVLMVVSDSGLRLIYFGYGMLCVGVIWQMWLRNIGMFTRLKKTDRWKRNLLLRVC